eukprot:3734696-Prymnesium_polylepis.1
MGRWQETVCPPCDRWIASRGLGLLERSTVAAPPLDRLGRSWGRSSTCWGLDPLGRSSRSWDLYATSLLHRFT